MPLLRRGGLTLETPDELESPGRDGLQSLRGSRPERGEGHTLSRATRSISRRFSIRLSGRSATSLSSMNRRSCRPRSARC